MAASAPSFPPAPWQLDGEFFAVGGLMPIEKARPFVPAELEIVQVLPGMTLGAIAVARYTEGSTLTYSELVVAPALVRSEGHQGAWISQIYVDDETSLQAGRSLWGLPKELATFDWERQSEPRGPQSTLLRVTQNDTPILDFWAAPRWFSVPASLNLPVLSVIDGRPRPWQASLTTRARIASFHLEIPPAAPFAALRPQTLLGIHGENLQMRVPAPF